MSNGNENDQLVEVADKQGWHLQYINQRWKQLYELQKENGEQCLRYLLLTNSGGAIATISFLGTSNNTSCMIGAKWALMLFFIGLILVGLHHALLYHFISDLFIKWKSESRKYLGNGKSTRDDWINLNERDESRTAEPKWSIPIGYGSFLCFILGCIIGGISLF